MLKGTKTLLQGLNGLNWVVGLLFVGFAAILTLVDPSSFIDVARAQNMDRPEALVSWLGWSAVLMVPMIAAVHTILTRLVAIIDSMSMGQVFSLANAARLKLIAWALLATQIIDLISGALSAYTSELTGEYLGWSPGLTGWLAALMLFILARVFREGAAMRAELEGTV